MKIKTNSIIVLIIFFYQLVCAGNTLPTSDFYPGWNAAGTMQTFSKHDLYGHINGGAELFLEFGFDSLLLSYFTQGEQELSLEIYQMESPLSALGIYLMKCGREKPANEIETRNTVNRYQILMVRDKYFIQINNFPGSSAPGPAMIALAQQTIEPLPRNREQDIFKQLPNEERIPGSEQLIRGMYGLQKVYTFGPDDILGLSGKNFAVLADYDSPAIGIFTLLKIEYENDNQAQDIFLNLKSNLDPLLKIISEIHNSFTFSDYKDDFGIVQVDGKFIISKVNLKSLPGN